MSARTRILGIDPGSRLTGWGVLDSDGRHSVYVASGVIRAGTGEMSARLEVIFSAIQSLVGVHQPGALAIEQVFVHRNADSALKLGQARAAAICACFGADISVHEYAARAVKQAVVGKGGADKAQVAHMVSVLLNRRVPMQPDEADALAVALCHAHTQPLQRRLARLGNSAAAVPL